jgi:hypothetical protein
VSVAGYADGRTAQQRVLEGKERPLQTSSGGSDSP